MLTPKIYSQISAGFRIWLLPAYPGLEVRARVLPAARSPAATKDACDQRSQTPGGPATRCRCDGKRIVPGKTLLLSVLIC